MTPAGCTTDKPARSRPAGSPPRALEVPLSGWGNYEPKRSRLCRPERLDELHRLVEAPEVGSLIPRGLGRSYGDSAIDDLGYTALCLKLDRLLDFDPATGLLSCEAGIALDDLIRTFLPRGYFLPVSPGTKFVTVGGAIAADIHGKNHHRDGTFGNFVESIDLLTGTGEVLSCSRQHHVETFRATLGGMGLTGVILAARLRLKPVESAYLLVDYQRAPDLDRALDLFIEGDARYDYSVAWIDCLASGPALGRSVLMRANHASRGDLPARLGDDPLRLARPGTRAVPFNLPSAVLNPWSVRAFNALYYARHTDGRQLVHYEPFFYPLDGIAHWNRLYGRRGFIQYQALFPTETSRQGIARLLEVITASGLASFLAVLKSTGLASDGLLSFPKPGHTLALDLPNKGPKLAELVQRLDRILLDHGGRLYLAKDATTTPEAFASMYENLDRFREAKRAVDPDLKFRSSQDRRLGLIDGEGR